MPAEIDLSALSQEELEYTWWLNERLRCQTDLLHLCREYLGYKDLRDDLHGGIAEELDTGEDHLFLLPRGHLKSSLITIGKTIQIVLNNQNVRIKIMNAAFSKAAEFMAEMKEHLQNENLVKLFPEILYENPEAESDAWRREALNVKRTAVVAGNTVEVLGVDTGNIGKHCDVLIFDDLHDDKNTMTAEKIDHVKRRFKLCLSVLEPGGLRWVVGTRWKREDLYGDLLKQGWKFTLREMVEDDKFIFPGRFNEKEAKKLKGELGTSLFYANYYNRILDEEDVVFPVALVREYVKSKLWNRVYIIVDPAIEEKQKSCETVIQTICQTENNMIYVQRSYGFHAGVQETVNSIFLEYLTYSSLYEVRVGVERVAYQKALHQWIERDQRERNLVFEVIELEPHGRSKDYRIRALGPFFRRNQILIHKNNSKKLKSQLLDYGGTTKVDHVDALAYLPDMLIMDSGNEILEMGVSSEDPYSLEKILEEEEELSYLSY